MNAITDENQLKNFTNFKINATEYFESEDEVFSAGNCMNYMPSVDEYILGLNIYLIIIIASSTFLTFIVICVYLKQLRSIITNTPPQFITKTVILCGVYPIITISCTVAAWVPKAFLISDTISTLCFMYCAYIFYSLCLDYIEGESNFIKIANQNAFNMRTPPCFCCCMCIHRSTITKNKFTLIRWMILQLSIVQTIIFVTLNVLYCEERRIYEEFFLYFVPFIATSIIIGVWGLNIAVRMISPYFTEYKLMPKYIVLQLILILCKLQPAVIEWLSGYLKFDCYIPFTPVIYRRAMIQLLIIIQMVLLFIGALFLYKSPSKR